ncbi:hypothetical protein B566_EDAN016303 [Ephemera danica]|nr:hypothetical protein B566_EDAN016303 [Ephemera danica]
MADEEDEKTLSFQDMELDERILKSIARLGWSEPTPVQEAAIPLMLEGRDVLIKARTGSGKTGAFAIPAIQKVLSSKQGSFREQTTSVLILAPYRELCTQIASHVSQLASTCSREVTCVDISPILDLAAQRPLLVACPDIVVSTPTRALMHFKAGNLQLSSLQLLVIDEADLVLTFGHGEQLRALLTEMPRTGRQTALASATLSPDLTEIKALALKRPAILKLEEPEVAPPIQLTHYHVSAEEEEKAVILLVLIKLGLIQGRTLIFVNTVDRCYKLKLFLEQFAIPACVLNSELPAAARCHAVSQFNQGVFDLLIASDERDLENPGSVEETEDVKPGKKGKNKKGKEQGKKKGKRNKDQESGVSRGIDFHVSERPLMETVDKYLGGTSTCPAIKPFQFKMEEVEGFRYRARDAWRAVTRIAVREARLKEIRQEVINCKRLSAYFEEHPKDLASLRHDKALHTVKLQPHLAHVPDYIIPASLKRLASGTSRRRRYAEEEGAAAGSSETKVKMGRAEAKYQARKRNPLLSMEFAGFSKKKKK